MIFKWFAPRAIQTELMLQTDDVDCRRIQVLSYGEVASMAGVRSARLVGWILAASHDHDLPWHRVLRADGTPAPHLAARQTALLRAEGVRFVKGRIAR